MKAKASATTGVFWPSTCRAFRTRRQPEESVMRFVSRPSALRGSMIGCAIGLSMAFAALQPAGASEGVSVFPDPSKIVAIGGSITEIVYALGEERHLVARDSTSLYPE